MNWCLAQFFSIYNPKKLLVNVLPSICCPAFFNSHKFNENIQMGLYF